MRWLLPLLLVACKQDPADSVKQVGGVPPITCLREFQRNIYYCQDSVGIQWICDSGGDRNSCIQRSFGPLFPGVKK
jgi:hypothetical protein